MKLPKISENFSFNLIFWIVSYLWREMVHSPYFQSESNINIKVFEYVTDYFCLKQLIQIEVW